MQWVAGSLALSIHTGQCTHQTPFMCGTLACTLTHSLTHSLCLGQVSLAALKDTAEYDMMKTMADQKTLQLQADALQEEKPRPPPEDSSKAGEDGGAATDKESREKAEKVEGLKDEEQMVWMRLQGLFDKMGVKPDQDAAGPGSQRADNAEVPETGCLM